MQMTSTTVSEVLSLQTGPSLQRGLVQLAEADGSISVDCDQRPGTVRCALLFTADGAKLDLSPGDAVLVWLPSPLSADGVVLGRIGAGLAGLLAPHNAKQMPDELVVEAKQQLTLKCGEGSITLRGDGKVLIQGKDLISRAQRTNRIKGGSVAIN